MNNKVVFTHDVPGERKWLLEIFSDYRSLETKDSRIWPTDFPTPGNNNTLYEIPYCDNVDYDRLLATDIEKVKSFFVDNPDLVFLDNKNWGYASSYVSRVSYSSWKDQPKYWVLHIARSGTTFVESLLEPRRTKHRHHVGLVPDINFLKIYKDCKANPDVHIVFVYRPEMWETLTSTILAETNGYHHHRSFDWSAAKPVTIAVESMERFYWMVVSTFSFWCNLRSMLPDHSFSLLNGTEMFQRYENFTEHGPVNYDKKMLITNYDSAKDLWHRLYANKLNQVVLNSVNHLKTMKCQTDMDWLFS